MQSDQGFSAAPAPGGEPAPAAPRQRVRLDLAYDGRDFCGWAAQPGLRSVQGVLEAALELITRVPCPLTVAGRTDAGVHARGQVAHFDLPTQVWEALPGRGDLPAGEALARRLNRVLSGGQAEERPAGPGADVVVYAARAVPPQFDARFSALWRRYEYRIADRPETRDPRERGQVWWVEAKAGELNLEVLNVAAESLVGLHDFGAFCKPREGATTVRDLQEFTFARGADGQIRARVVADAFCHSLVRALVGACVTVAQGVRDAAWIGELLEVGVAARARGGVAVAPAHGLSLMEVGYPPLEAAALAARAEAARARRDE